jgi:hypothetical protein
LAKVEAASSRRWTPDQPPPSKPPRSSHPRENQPKESSWGILPQTTHPQQSPPVTPPKSPPPTPPPPLASQRIPTGFYSLAQGCAERANLGPSPPETLPGTGCGERSKSELVPMVGALPSQPILSPPLFFAPFAPLAPLYGQSSVSLPKRPLQPADSH